MAKKKNRKGKEAAASGKDEEEQDVGEQKADVSNEPTKDAEPPAPVRRPQVKSEVELPHGVTGVVLEPEGSHNGSVILLHGLGDDGSYWEPYHESLLRSCPDARCVRWIVLNAPKRKVWKEKMTAWFRYIGPEKSGQDVEDEIKEDNLLEMRAAIHPLIEQEADRLRAHGGLSRVLLMGSSQGGSMALDLALTMPSGLLGRNRLAGVAMLRSLALSATAEAATEKLKGSGLLASLAAIGAPGPTQVLAVSGENDDTFILSLVRKQLKTIEPYAVVTHEVLPDLDHDTDHDARETAHAVQFIIERLQLRSQRVDSVEDLALSLSDIAAHDSSQTKACDKDWTDLNEEELKLAKQLGIKGANAWDAGTAPVWSQYWRKLTQQQRQAAEKLGFTQQSWDES